MAGKEGKRPPPARERDPNHEHDRDGEREGDGNGEGDGDGDGHGIAGDETEEDDVEAVTPEGSVGASDVARWHGAHTPRTRPRLPPSVFGPPSHLDSVSRSAPRGESPAYGDPPGSGVKDAPQDEDMMRAALALCGLGRRSG